MFTACGILFICLLQRSESQATAAHQILDTYQKFITRSPIGSPGNLSCDSYPISSGDTQSPIACSVICANTGCPLWVWNRGAGVCQVCRRCAVAVAHMELPLNHQVYRWSGIVIQVPPTPALYISMDKLTDLILPADIGDIQGVLENAPSLVGNAVRDHALQLDGNNQSVNLGNLRNRCLGDFRHCSAGWSVMFWVKLSSINANPQYVLAGGAQTSWSDGVAISWKTDGFFVRVKMGTDMWRILWISINTNQWFHIVAVWSINTGLSLYVDGCLIQQMQTPWPVSNRGPRPHNLTIGRLSGSYSGFGALTLDEFYMYEYAETDNFAGEIYWYYFL